MVLGLFGKSTFLDRDVEEWLFENWAWLMRNLGGVARLSKTPFILPTREFFPPTETEGHQRAEYILGLVKTHMGMADWPCVLESYERPEANQVVADVGLVRTGSWPNGTFRISDGRPIITYAEDLLEQPRHLIATLAHELSHYLLATIKEEAPGGDELHELATELTVAYSGFGVFGANHAFHFEQHRDTVSQGWRSQRNGFFSERTWAFGIALFAALKSVDIPYAKLKDSIADQSRRAGRYLEKNRALMNPLFEIA